MDNQETNQSAEIKKPKAKLMLVDDEELLVKILEKMLSKHYEVRTANSGLEALEILNQGYYPGVILSDQRMPEMNGDEFLERTIKIVPDAVRIILTGYTSPKDIIPCVNKGHAYMFLTKPVEELELIQAIKVAVSHYQSTTTNKRLISELNNTVGKLNSKNTELKMYNDKLSLLVNENKSLFSQALQAITGIINNNERLYFTPHSKYVTQLSKYIAESLDFKSETVSDTTFASLLHSAVMIGIPQKFNLYDPIDLDNEDEIILYFEHFNKVVNTLIQVKLLSKFGRIISQIWERNDGTGYPNSISGGMISPEAQIISLANIYHNRVYRVKPADYQSLLKTGKITQSPDETKARHDNAINFIYSHLNWFEFNIFHTFQEITKKRRCPVVIPFDKPLMLRYSELGMVSSGYNDDINSDDDIFSQDAFSISFKTDGRRLIEKQISISELDLGMIIGQHVVTKNGILVVKPDTEVDSTILTNIRQLESAGLLESYLNVLVSEG
ncbi:MAG: Response regulator [Bacteroidota bacterium]|nr:Response regulator [Bacteroidota bacterium]